MPMTRRHFMVAAGGTTLALAGAGGAFLVTRTPGRALAPWATLDQPVADVRLDAFRHAILAPNPHNRQPWRITLVGNDQAIISCDLDRRLPETDPFDRQITIGFGCFLELARMVTEARGKRLQVQAFPDGAPEVPARLDARPIAHLRFLDGPARQDALMAGLRTRRSAKVPFEPQRKIDGATLQAIMMGSAGAAGSPGNATLHGTRDEVAVKSLRDQTWRAWMIETETIRTFKESVDLMRIGKSEIEANPDGISLGGAMLELLAAAGQVTRATLADPKSSAFRAGIDKYRPILATAMSYVWVTTTGNTRSAQLAAGRAYVRANLAATLAGVAMHPISQALQEYPEMAAAAADVRATLTVGSNDTLQMLARIGYAEQMPPSPRWPVESKIRPA